MPEAQTASLQTGRLPDEQNEPHWRCISVAVDGLYQLGYTSSRSSETRIEIDKCVNCTYSSTLMGNVPSPGPTRDLDSRRQESSQKHLLCSLTDASSRQIPASAFQECSITLLPGAVRVSIP